MTVNGYVYFNCKGLLSVGYLNFLSTLPSTCTVEMVNRRVDEDFCCLLACELAYQKRSAAITYLP